MSTGPIRLREEQRTMLMSLYLHALDAQSPQPILGDEFAADLLNRVDHDVSGMTGLAGNLPVICARARLIDDAARSFLDRHPDAVVLHLGCGLDSRVLRIAPGPGVDWIEVDQEPVIELRHRLYPDHDGGTMIAASVTDPRWWDQVPSGRPQLVLAEGLLMYLAPDGLRATITAAFEHPAPHHTLVADTVAPWVTRVAGRQPAMRAAETGFRSSTKDLSAVANSLPGMTLRGEISLVSTAAHHSRGAMSGFLRLFDLMPAGHRAMVLRTYRTAGGLRAA
jgi:O-methyltransferase